MTVRSETAEVSWNVASSCPLFTELRCLSETSVLVGEGLVGVDRVYHCSYSTDHDDPESASSFFPHSQPLLPRYFIVLMALLYRHLRIHQIFGANTDVGKTIFATALTRASAYRGHNVLYLKPVSTGDIRDADDLYG